MDRFSRVFRNGVLACGVVVSVVLIALQRYAWAFGFLTAALWSLSSLLLTLYIIRVALSEQKKHTLSLALLIKFPLLYALGLAVAVLRIFPAASLLTGVSVTFVVFAGVRVWLKPL